MSEIFEHSDTEYGEFVTQDSCDKRYNNLKEFLIARIDHEKELSEAANATRDDTLKAQAIEYSRRLDELNHNHAAMTGKDKTYFTKEQHDGFLMEYQLFRDATNNSLTKIQTWGAAGLVLLGVMEFLFKTFLK
jgi:hypothetical protein